MSVEVQRNRGAVLAAVLAEDAPVRTARDIQAQVGSPLPRAE